jgi:tetratricopeptide (TPR) repeat protein
MQVTLRASSQGMANIKLALKKGKEEKGWRRDAYEWINTASKILGRDHEEIGYFAEGISDKTWEKFLDRKAIGAQAFQTYCYVLDLDWREIYAPIDFEKLGFSAIQDYPFDSIFDKAQGIYSKGKVSEAYELFVQLFDKIEKRQYHLTMEVLGDFYLNFGIVQMQRGDIHGKNGAFYLASECLKIFSTLGDQSKIAESYNLLGICFRQVSNFKEAIRNYNLAIKITGDDNKLIPRKMHTFHDLAVSSFLHAEQERSEDYLYLANNLFNQSNLFFLNEEPSFYKIASIRTAEMQLRSGNISLARDTLDAFEEIPKYNSLTLPFQALFLRINAEKYLALNQVDKGMEFFVEALRLNRQECYSHQLIELTKLRLRHEDKFDKTILDD